MQGCSENLTNPGGNSRASGAGKESAHRNQDPGCGDMAGQAHGMPFDPGKGLWTSDFIFFLRFIYLFERERDWGGGWSRGRGRDRISIRLPADLMTLRS